MCALGCGTATGASGSSTWPWTWLALDGRETMRLPYCERRRLLEQLDLPPACVVSDRFDDGAAPFDVVRERGLEGVVAKRLDSRYGPGERGWVKQKNRETWWRYGLKTWWRYELKREGCGRPLVGGEGPSSPTWRESGHPGVL
jgi:hypothetical protein